ncbi:hypothetical protein CH063_09288, partial [Colletotrichum higginsianum]
PWILDTIRILTRLYGPLDLYTRSDARWGAHLTCGVQGGAWRKEGGDMARKSERRANIQINSREASSFREHIQHRGI